MDHRLKLETEFFEAVDNGDKLFEIRKNDRDYKVGDTISFEEVINAVPTGRWIYPRLITYVLLGPCYGLQDGYCIFQLGVFLRNPATGEERKGEDYTHHKIMERVKGNQ